MARNTKAMKRGWNYDTPNALLKAMVDGTEAFKLRKDAASAYAGFQVGTPTYTLAGTIDGAGVSLATGYSASASNRFSALEICADTGSTDLTGDTYEAAIHGKLTIGTTQTNASLMTGLFSLDVGTVNLAANYYALRGHLDFWGSCTISGTSHIGALSAYVENEVTTTVGAGQYLDGIDIYQVGAPSVNATGFNSAVNIRASAAASAWKRGIYMPAGSVVQAIQIGTLSSTTAGSGIKMDATTTRAVEVNVDDADTARAVGTQARAIFGRTMIYADNACEDWGVHGLSKISGVAKTGNVSAGVVGAFESTGTCSIATGSGNSYFAGVMGRVGGGGTFTITSSNVVGVLSFYNTSITNAFTGTGTCAFMAAASEIAGSGNWDYGLYIKDTVYGIECIAEPTAAGRIAKFSGTISAPNLTDGYGAVEVDATFIGTYAGISAALSAWVNVTGTGAVGSFIVAAQNNGIYADSGANTGSTVIFGMRAQGILTDAPTVFAPFSINTSNREITALFHMTSNPDVGYRAASTTNSSKVGDVPLFCDADGTQYFVRIYSAYG